jgi:DEAD/DEAH box helicase domain-containing protein
MHITVIKQFETINVMEDGGKLSSDVAVSLKNNSSESRKSCRAGACEKGEKTNGAPHVIDGEQSKHCSTGEGEEQGEETSKCEEIYMTSFCGCGVVNVKRTVHGYKKLSLITRTEISRSELSLPDMEFETFGLWFDTEPALLAPLLGSKYGEGVHALSHAILAVAPIFEPGLVREDLECDHAYFSPTRLCIFDERAGGSGSCNRLWPHFFVPENNIINAALDLLRNCDTCSADQGYEGGCPACLHASQCLKFNMNLSRSGAIVIGKRLLERIKTTELYKKNELFWRQSKRLPPSPSRDLTPRRKARREAVKRAKEMRNSQSRQFVIGRPSFTRTEGAVIFDGEQQELE